MVGEQRDVVLALAQRRQIDVDDVDSVEQFLAEAAGLDLGFEIFIGGAQHAHVERHRIVGAERVCLALLQRAQQLDLQRERQLADLVEQDGALVGGLQQADLVLAGAGERAALVAEQLALEQILRAARRS